MATASKPTSPAVQAAIDQLVRAVKDEVTSALAGALGGMGRLAPNTKRARQFAQGAKGYRPGQRVRRNTDEKIERARALIAQGLHGVQLAEALGVTPGALYQFTNYHRISLK